MKRSLALRIVTGKAGKLCSYWYFNVGTPLYNVGQTHTGHIMRHLVRKFDEEELK